MMKWGVFLNQLYVSLIFIGITLILTSIVLILFDMKRSRDNVRQLEEKKAEILEAVSDAEQLVDEMNKFSDYILTQIEQKNEEVLTNLKYFDIKMKDMEPAEEDIQKDVQEDVREDSASVEPMMAQDESSHQPEMVRSEKVIPLSSKYRDVVKLTEEGLSDMEIAKSLNMGKGEIRLIREIRK